MKRFIEGENRFQSTLFPESLEDYIAKDNPIRIVDAFVDKLKLKELGFDRAEPSDTGRPGYLPATMLKIYISGYLNRIQSSRRLERESYRNGELARRHKEIACIREDAILGKYKALFTRPRPTADTRLPGASGDSW